MKKVLALIVALMMIVSMIPVMAITTSAANVPGDWTTYRFSGGYKEPEPGEELSYTPAPGYEYTDEGFHMTSADYTGITPSGTIQSKDKVSLKDGVYMELRIDQFAYGGEKGTDDHWICFSIMDSKKVEPGNTNDGYGQGWQSLLRTPGQGGAGTLQSFTVADGPTGWGHKGDVAVTPPVDENGKETYTLEISWDGTNYTIAICGVVANGSADITTHLNSLDPNGEFYIGVSFHTGAAGTPLEATMLKFGTSKDTAETPVGNDSELPEENINVKAPIAEADSIPANQPCLLLDATKTSYSGDLPVSGMTIVPQGDNSLKILPEVGNAYFTWGMRNSLSYDAADFPVIGIFVQDPNEVTDGCLLYYCAGDNLTADGAHIVRYASYDDGTRYWGDGEEYAFMTIDMREMLTEEEFAEGWTGRINSLRFDYENMYLEGDAENDYIIFHYAGIFRSVEEANAYQDAYAASLNLTPSETTESEPADSDNVSEPVGSDPAGSEPTGSEPTGSEPTGSEPAGSADSENAGSAESGSAADSAAETEEEKSGCSATVLGSVAVLLSAAAAAVVLKKKD
ncbi:MAG: hypothetical protein IJW90_00975 [Clostridia bacterium]|nr:hypothetical protein [Clostridia bacterium]